MKNVKRITLKHHESIDGVLTAFEEKDFDFSIKRVYTVTNTKENCIRRHHAHRKLNQIFFSVNGVIEVYLEDVNGDNETVILDSPHKACFCGSMIWHTLKYSKGAILMVLADDQYEESDYIRDYDLFKEEGKHHEDKL